jgi:predicted RNase H-like nuclease (RuvC/YqgF family)
MFKFVSAFLRVNVCNSLTQTIKLAIHWEQSGGCKKFESKRSLKGSVVGILHRHSQYATKADFKILSHEVKTHLNQLEEKTDRLEKKTDRLEAKVDHLDQKVTQFEVRMSSEMADLKAMLNANTDECKNEFSKLRADVAVLTNSHKYVLWIGGGLATICISVFGLCISILLPSIK